MNMQKTFFLFLAILISYCLTAQQLQLTPNQKEKDFVYLYNALKENYSYFGVAKRKFNVDWLNKKQDYIHELRNTTNDSSYVLTLFSIIRKLKNAHLSLFINVSAKKYKELYENISLTQPNYKKWVDALNNPKARPDYWAKFIETGDSVYLNYMKHKNAQSPKSKLNVSDTIIEKSNIGVISINSLDGLRLEEDGKIIDSFFRKIKNFPTLIIDISDNGGGSDSYWKKDIVEKLLDSSIVYKRYLFAKNGLINRYFHPDFFEGAKTLKKGFLPNISAELLDGTYIENEWTDTLSPDASSIHFKGKIYLLVSHRVFSSAEGFAQFCKSTKWATIAGERTGGDGIGSDPAIICLPESGLLLTYPTISGFNYDGAINFEERTVPDIKISAKTSEERLNKLIEYIEQHKNK